jgi:hypothetical protein
MATHLAEMKAARRRAISMGAHHAWTPEFNRHPLAACIDNHTACIDAEPNTGEDTFAILCWILTMARAVNRFCEENKVAGDAASEYWLERFAWVYGRVCGKIVDMEMVGG